MNKTIMWPFLLNLKILPGRRNWSRDCSNQHLFTELGEFKMCYSLEVFLNIINSVPTFIVMLYVIDR